MEFVLEEGKELRSDCSTLVLPALSIGNVGQLAVDLLILSSGAERIGYLDDPYVLPCVGNDAYGPVPRGELAFPLEAYDSVSNKVTFVQLRSPILKGKMCDFAMHLADFAVATGKKNVVVLSGLDFGRWQNVDMSIAEHKGPQSFMAARIFAHWLLLLTTSMLPSSQAALPLFKFTSGLQIHYLSSENSDGADDNCEKLGWKKVQGYNLGQRRWEYLNRIAEGNQPLEEDANFEEEEEEEDYYASLPFAALFSCFKARGLKVTCLLCYCSEGDNIPDSMNLAEAACKLLGRSPSNLLGDEGGGWRIPLSWKTLYGPPPDTSMF